MSPDELATALDHLSGRVVSAKQITGNSIQIWLDVPPKDRNAIGFWVDPPWRLVDAAGVVATSADMPWEMEPGEPKQQYKGRNQAAWSPSNLLVGRRLVNAKIDVICNDLVLNFGDGVRLVQFSVWRDAPNWMLRIYSENRRISVWINRVEQEPIAAAG